MKYLITYASRNQGDSMWEFCMEITDKKPILWLAETQKYPEIYVLINSEVLTDDEANEYDGAFKGM